MQPDQTTVWGSLAITNPQGNGLIFVDPSTFQPVTALVDFAAKLNTTPAGTGAIYFSNSGDLTGTDAVNVGWQLDSYVPTTLQNPAVVGMIAGFTVSVSRGTRAVPAVSLDGDFAGEFSGYSYMGVAGSLLYKLISGIRHYVSGASATDPGGRLRLGTKANAGAYTEWLELDNLGQFVPVSPSLPGTPLVPSVQRLGKNGFGFGALTLDYAIAGVAGNVQQNKPCGRAIIAAGASSVIVGNTLVTANSIVICTLGTVDATLTFIKAAVPGAGAFTVTGNANATAPVAVNWLVINTDS